MAKVNEVEVNVSCNCENFKEKKSENFCGFWDSKVCSLPKNENCSSVEENFLSCKHLKEPSPKDSDTQAKDNASEAIDPHLLFSDCNRTEKCMAIAYYKQELKIKDKQITNLSIKNMVGLNHDETLTRYTSLLEELSSKDKEIKELKENLTISGYNKMVSEKDKEIERLKGFQKREDAVDKNKNKRLEETVEKLKFENESLNRIKLLIKCINSDII